MNVNGKSFVEYFVPNSLTLCCFLNFEQRFQTGTKNDGQGYGRRYSTSIVTTHVPVGRCRVWTFIIVITFGAGKESFGEKQNQGS